MSNGVGTKTRSNANTNKVRYRIKGGDLVPKPKFYNGGSRKYSHSKFGHRPLDQDAKHKTNSSPVDASQPVAYVGLPYDHATCWFNKKSQITHGTPSSVTDAEPAVLHDDVKNKLSKFKIRTTIPELRDKPRGSKPTRGRERSLPGSGFDSDTDAEISTIEPSEPTTPVKTDSSEFFRNSKSSNTIFIDIMDIDEDSKFDGYYCVWKNDGVYIRIKPNDKIMAKLDKLDVPWHYYVEGQEQVTYERKNTTKTPPKKKAAKTGTRSSKKKNMVDSSIRDGEAKDKAFDDAIREHMEEMKELSRPALPGEIIPDGVEPPLTPMGEPVEPTEPVNQTEENVEQAKRKEINFSYTICATWPFSQKHEFRTVQHIEHVSSDERVDSMKSMALQHKDPEYQIVEYTHCLIFMGREVPLTRARSQLKVLAELFYQINTAGTYCTPMSYPEFYTRTQRMLSSVNSVNYDRKICADGSTPFVDTIILAYHYGILNFQRLGDQHFHLPLTLTSICSDTATARSRSRKWALLRTVSVCAGLGILMFLFVKLVMCRTHLHGTLLPLWYRTELTLRLSLQELKSGSLTNHHLGIQHSEPASDHLFVTLYNEISSQLNQMPTSVSMPGLSVQTILNGEELNYSALGKMLRIIPTNAQSATRWFTALSNPSSSSRITLSTNMPEL